MKKSQLSFLFLAFALCAVCFISSCSSDDEPDPAPTVVAYQGSWIGTDTISPIISLTVSNINDQSWITAYSYSITQQSGGSTWSTSRNRTVSTGITQISNNSFTINTSLKKDGDNEYIQGTFTSDTDLGGTLHILDQSGNIYVDIPYMAKKK